MPIGGGGETDTGGVTPFSGVLPGHCFVSSRPPFFRVLLRGCTCVNCGDHGSGLLTKLK